MRDNSNGLPEILEAAEKEDLYYGFIGLARNDEHRKFRLGISREGYLALKRALQIRPFDQMPGVPCRYFFVPSVRRLGGERAMIGVRVEQGRDGQQFDIEAPLDLVANLMWFYQLDDWLKAEHLMID